MASRALAAATVTALPAVPYFRPALGDAEIDEVVATLRSGWLTTGPKVARFEAEFAEAVGARYAIALNSATAALHLAVEALGLEAGDAVLVPTMTFAATAEVLRYRGAHPILVDCDPVTFLVDLADAERKIDDLRAGRLPAQVPRDAPVVGLMPVHVAGLLADLDAVRAFATRHRLWVVEDAAHSFPAAWRSGPNGAWQRCGEGSADVSCFSFYANKTITTGEGGMAVTDDGERAARIRSLSLHGLSHDAWGRYTSKGSWDYRIVAPGYKYNLTDVAAAIGIHQLARAEAMRIERQTIAGRYRRELAGVVGLPPEVPDRIHAWHLFQIRLPETLERDAFLAGLRARGIAFSVHWRPLHLHPYWAETWGWRSEHLPVASAVWTRSVSLPIFPGMRDDEIEAVTTAVRELAGAGRDGEA